MLASKSSGSPKPLLQTFGKGANKGSSQYIVGPLFFKGKNYNGHNPSIDRSPLLQHYAYTVFPAELAKIASSALVIPLGKTVEHIIAKLSEDGKLPSHYYLHNFPHPSGANGHRIEQFQQLKVQLRE